MEEEEEEEDDEEEDDDRDIHIMKVELRTPPDTRSIACWEIMEAH